MIQCPKCREWYDFKDAEELKKHVQLECSGQAWN